MADENEEIVVSVDEAEKKAETTVVKTGGDEAVADLKGQYADMQAQRDAERERAAAADQRAREASQREQAARREAETARAQVDRSNADSIDAGIAAANAEIATAEAEAAKLMESGDYVAAEKARTKGQLAAARLVRLDEAKADLEVRKETPRTEARSQAQASDPVEAYVAGRTEPTANWLRSHRDWVLDPKKNAKLTAAHWAALAEDLVPDTQAYFDHVETAIGLKQPPAKQNGGAVAKPRPRAAPVAPVGGSSGGTSGGGNEVRLSPGEARAATDGTHTWTYDDPQKRFKRGDPIGVQEFARRKLKMMEQGLYDKSFTEA